MPPTTTTSTTTPLTIPHPLPHPLPPTLLTDLTTLLVRSDTIPHLLTTLETSCAQAGWQDRVRARVLELLRNTDDSGVKSIKELTDLIVREARGGEKEEEGREGEGGGKGKGRDEGEKGIRVPKKAVEEGTRIVRGVLEGRVVVQAEVDFWAT
ncbi:hypothetical protein ACLMJK_000762 [Lecanora helva]